MTTDHIQQAADLLREIDKNKLNPGEGNVFLDDRAILLEMCQELQDRLEEYCVNRKSIFGNVLTKYTQINDSLESVLESDKLPENAKEKIERCAGELDQSIVNLNTDNEQKVAIFHQIEINLKNKVDILNDDTKNIDDLEDKIEAIAEELNKYKENENDNFNFKFDLVECEIDGKGDNIEAQSEEAFNKIMSYVQRQPNSKTQQIKDLVEKIATSRENNKLNSGSIEKVWGSFYGEKTYKNKDKKTNLAHRKIPFYTYHDIIKAAPLFNESRENIDKKRIEARESFLKENIINDPNLLNRKIGIYSNEEKKEFRDKIKSNYVRRKSLTGSESHKDRLKSDEKYRDQFSELRVTNALSKYFDEIRRRFQDRADDFSYIPESEREDFVNDIANEIGVAGKPLEKQNLKEFLFGNVAVILDDDSLFEKVMASLSLQSDEEQDFASTLKDFIDENFEINENHIIDLFERYKKSYAEDQEQSINSEPTRTLQFELLTFGFDEDLLLVLINKTNYKDLIRSEVDTINTITANHNRDKNRILKAFEEYQLLRLSGEDGTDTLEKINDLEVKLSSVGLNEDQLEKLIDYRTDEYTNFIKSHIHKYTKVHFNNYRDISHLIISQFSETGQFNQNTFDKVSFIENKVSQMGFKVKNSKKILELIKTQTENVTKEKKDQFNVLIKSSNTLHNFLYLKYYDKLITTADNILNNKKFRNFINEDPLPTDEELQEFINGNENVRIQINDFFALYNHIVPSQDKIEDTGYSIDNLINNLTRVHGALEAFETNGHIYEIVEFFNDIFYEAKVEKVQRKFRDKIREERLNKLEVQDANDQSEDELKKSNKKLADYQKACRQVGEDNITPKNLEPFQKAKDELDQYVKDNSHFLQQDDDGIITYNTNQDESLEKAKEELLFIQNHFINNRHIPSDKKSDHKKQRLDALHDRIDKKEQPTKSKNKFKGGIEEPNVKTEITKISDYKDSKDDKIRQRGELLREHLKRLNIKYDNDTTLASISAELDNLQITQDEFQNKVKACADAREKFTWTSPENDIDSSRENLIKRIGEIDDDGNRYKGVDHQVLFNYLLNIAKLKDRADLSILYLLNDLPKELTDILSRERVSSEKFENSFAEFFTFINDALTFDESLLDLSEQHKDIFKQLQAEPNLKHIIKDMTNLLEGFTKTGGFQLRGSDLEKMKHASSAKKTITSKYELEEIYEERPAFSKQDREFYNNDVRPEIAGVDPRGHNIKGLDDRYHGIEILQFTFKDAKVMTDPIFQNAILRHCHFDGVDFSKMDEDTFKSINFYKCEFKNCTFSKSLGMEEYLNAYHNSHRACTFNECKLEGGENYEPERTKPYVERPVIEYAINRLNLPEPPAISARG